MTEDSTRNKREPRAQSNRENSTRPTSWRPPNVLPEPEPRPGWRHRWIRVSHYGNPDNRNVSMRFKEGWEPVRREEYPEITTVTDRAAVFPDGIEVGGLVLCRAPEELMAQRAAHYAGLTAQQLEGVNNSYLRDNNPLVKKEVFEATTVVKKGTGSSR